MPSVEDILLARAQLEGASRRRKGEIWGGVVEGVSQIPGQILRDRAAQTATNRESARQAAADRRAQTDSDIRVSAEQRAIADQETKHGEAQREQQTYQRGKEAVQAWVKQHGAAIDAKQPGYSAAMLAAIETPEGLKDVRSQLLKAPEPFKLIERDPTKDLVNPTTGAVVTAGTQEAPKLTFGAPQTAVVGGRRTLLRPGSDGAMYDLRGQKVQDASPEPKEATGPQPTWQWVVRNGKEVYTNQVQDGDRPQNARVKATEDERKSAGFYSQMTQAIEIMDALEPSLTQDELYRIQTLPQEKLIGLINRGSLSENAKRYLRAFEQFTESRLRAVSGAAIADSEYERDRRTYAKQYGETAGIAADRKQARQGAHQALRTRAGVALSDPAEGGGGRIYYDADGNPR